MKNIIIGTVIGLIVIVFAILNTEIITVNLLFWEFSTPSAILLVIVFFLGLLTGWIFCSLKTRKKLKDVESGIKES
jgi:uncharacterized integral membrane protein